MQQEFRKAAFDWICIIHPERMLERLYLPDASLNKGNITWAPGTGQRGQFSLATYDTF